MANEYYNHLISLPQHWKSYSLRDGQYMTSAIQYDPVMDAARVTIPPFAILSGVGKLTAPVDDTTVMMPINSSSAAVYPVGRVIRLDLEIMTVVKRLSSTIIQVTRASFGSLPTPHSVGTQVYHANNSLRAQSRLPLGTSDNHRYVFVWDALWTDTYYGMPFNHKAFQFSSGGNDGDTIWLEPGVRYSSSACTTAQIGNAHTRSYNKVGGPADWMLSTGDQLGPGITDTEIAFRSFCIDLNKWTRHVYVLDQKYQDYDPLSVYMSDETRDPILTVNNVPISVRPTGKTPNSIAKFWIEFNTSEDDYFCNWNRICYVKNFVALIDLYDLTDVLIKPGGSAPTKPNKPLNARMV